MVTFYAAGKLECSQSVPYIARELGLLRLVITKSKFTLLQEAKYMAGGSKPKEHHWWPVGLQRYWADKTGNVSWIEPSGKIEKKKSANRKIGMIKHGHTSFRGDMWENNFESEFDIDNEVHQIIGGLKALKPFGRTPSEFLALIKLAFNKKRTLRDICKFYHLEEKLHRNLLLFMHSLLIRSPANRAKYESYPSLFGLPSNEEVGKGNMLQNYRAAKKLCQSAPISNQYLILLHSPFKKFIFGDGCLDWITSGLVVNRINGKTIIPLTPHLCVYLSTPMAMRSVPNCASLCAAPWMVEAVNKITQIYSKNQLFFQGKAPELTQHFRKGEFLEHAQRIDVLIDTLDEIAPTEQPNRTTLFNSIGLRYK